MTNQTVSQTICFPELIDDDESNVYTREHLGFARSGRRAEQSTHLHASTQKGIDALHTPTPATH